MYGGHLQGQESHGDKDRQRPSFTEPTSAISASSIAQVRDTAFKHIFGSGSIMRFKKMYERKVKPPDANVVILQDCKDVALYSCDVKLLTKEFIIMFHTKAVDKYLRSLIIYFQFFIQIWQKVQSRRAEAGRKLRQPGVTKVENHLRDDLSDLRSVVAKDYAAILTGVGDARKFHHMKSENNVSLSDKDRKHYEMFMKMVCRVVWIALRKKHFLLIEKELDTLIRTKDYSFTEHDAFKCKQNVALPKEQSIFRGKAYRSEKKLLARSPCVQELIFDIHDYRILAIGVTDVEDRTDRQTYLEIAYTAPEELLQDLDVSVGILGVPRKFLDPLLNEDLTSTKRRSSYMKPVTDFVIPPHTPYDDTKIYETLPKLPCRYKESEVSANARRDQCKMWQEYVRRQGQYPMTPSVSDRISLPSYSTIRSITKSISKSSGSKSPEMTSKNSKA